MAITLLGSAGKRREAVHNGTSVVQNRPFGYWE
jgi:hypothetical protein